MTSEKFLLLYSDIFVCFIFFNIHICYHIIYSPKHRLLVNIHRPNKEGQLVMLECRIFIFGMRKKCQDYLQTGL